MLASLNLFNNIVDFLIWAIILSALLSWLIGFNILNINNKLAHNELRVFDEDNRADKTATIKTLP